MHFGCQLLAKIVLLYAFQCVKFFCPKIWSCKFFDKFQVWKNQRNRWWWRLENQDKGNVVSGGGGSGWKLFPRIKCSSRCTRGLDLYPKNLLCPFCGLIYLVLRKLPMRAWITRSEKTSGADFQCWPLTSHVDFWLPMLTFDFRC